MTLDPITGRCSFTNERVAMGAAIHRFPRYARLLASVSDDLRAKVEETGVWSSIAQELVPPGFTAKGGNPWALIRALSEDVEEGLDELKREKKARLDGIAKYGDASKHTAALRKLDAAIDEVQEQADRLFDAANPTEGRYGEWEPLRCKIAGCREELRDGAESTRTGGRCPAHYAQALGGNRRPVRDDSLEAKVNSALAEIGEV